MGKLQQESQRPRVYVGNLDPMVSEQEIMQIFSPFGTVTGIDMPKEGLPPASKGYCFVEFLDQKMADRSIMVLQDFFIGGRQLRIGTPTALRRTVPMGPTGIPQLALAAPGAGASLLGNGIDSATAAVLAAGGDTACFIDMRRVGVSGIPADVLQCDIQTIFQTFGMILRCEFVPPIFPPQRHSGCCYVEFAGEHAASQALEAMHGFKLGGVPVKMQRGTPPMPAPGVVARTAEEMLRAPPTAASRPRPPAAVAVAAAAAQQALPATPAKIKCLLLENMVGPGEVDDELADEVKEECETFGQVDNVKIHEAGVRRNVRVFVRFVDQDAGGRTAKNMNGRFFGGRQVRAYSYDDAAFTAGKLDLPVGQ